MPLFVAPARPTRENDKAVISKLQAPKASGAVSLKGGETIFTRIKNIETQVNLELAKYIPQYDLFRTPEEAREAFYCIKESGEGVLDLETSSLDPNTGTIAGIVLYTPGMKPCYIPTGHVSYITEQRYENQVDPRVIQEELEKWQGLNWDGANFKFDMRWCWHKYGVHLNCFWDTQIAAHLMNENEPYKGLKHLHLKYCDSQDERAITYEKLFSGIPFTHVPIKTGYLYAAGDGIKTWEVKEFQQQYLNAERLPGPYKVYREIEIPLIPATVRMEDIGLGIRKEYQKELSQRYHKKHEEAEASYNQEIERLQPKIDEFCKKNPTSKEASLIRGKAISPNSSKQLAVLLYDVLRHKVVDKKHIRGTGEDILDKMEFDICKRIVEMRKINKLLSTYIDKMPKELNPVTGMIHASFQQDGTVTGRYSCKDPNLQNIPSKNKDIRPMFWAGIEYYLVSCDYSQQEPRILAFVSHDEQFRRAYIEGRDLYAECASKIFGVPYEDCQEEFPDGTENPEGGKRRYFCKSVILGLMYGRGAAAIAEQCGITVQKAQQIINDFYESFPQVKQWMDETIERACETGYVETIMGRKRRFPELLLPDYEFRYSSEYKKKNFDPLNFGEAEDMEVPLDVIDAYMAQIDKAYGFKAINSIIAAARENGIIIKDNTAARAEAKRQAINAIIQGSAADMTKLCMIKMHNDEKLLSIDTEAIIQVHDELICRAPKEHIHDATKRISEIMVEVAKEMVPIEIKWKCDTVVTEYWYGPSIKLDEVA